MKDLVLSNYNEGFVDLKFIMESSVIINGVVREIFGYKQIPILMMRKELYNYDREFRTFLISSAISYSKLSMMYSEHLIDYNNKLTKLYKSMDESINNKLKFRKEIINLKIRNSFSQDFPFSVLIDLLIKSNCPAKYYKSEIVEKVSKYSENHIESKFSLDILTINTQSIAYIENLKDLGRIKLTHEEQAVIYSLKDLNSIKTEITFDKYIDNWAERLLGGKAK